MTPRRQSFRVVVDNTAMPAWVPDRAPISHDSNPARGLAIAVVAGCVMWGIGAAIWWALVSGSCSK